MVERSILVVDDEPFNLDIVADYLADEGCRVDTVDGGEAALARLDDPARHYDLVVLDRMMPGIDGMQVLDHLRADPRLARIPVIMQTAAAAPEQVREGLAKGARYYLTKPFEPDSLRCIVRAALDDLAQREALLARLRGQAGALSLIERVEFSVRAPDEAADVAALLAQLCPEAGFVALGLAELIINGIEHGNLGISFEEKGRLRREGRWSEEVARRLALAEHASKRVRVQASRETGAWCFDIADEGLGFDHARYLELDPQRALAPNGRGIALARELAFADLRYVGAGNRVRARVTRALDA